MLMIPLLLVACESAVNKEKLKDPNASVATEKTDSSAHETDHLLLVSDSTSEDAPDNILLQTGVEIQFSKHGTGPKIKSG